MGYGSGAFWDLWKWSIVWSFKAGVLSPQGGLTYILCVNWHWVFVFSWCRTPHGDYGGVDWCVCQRCSWWPGLHQQRPQLFPATSDPDLCCSMPVWLVLLGMLQRNLGKKYIIWKRKYNEYNWSCSCYWAYYKNVYIINPLWPSDAKWWHRSWSALASVMACCLTAPSHYLNQCWLIIYNFLWIWRCQFEKLDGMLHF